MISELIPTAIESTDKLSLPLHGYVVVISGATSGVGKGLSTVLYRLGATIIAIGRSSSKLTNLQEELEGRNGNHVSPSSRVVTIPADFNDLNDISNAANQILSKFSSINFLINNAGFNCRPSSPTDDFTTIQGYNRCFGGECVYIVFFLHISQFFIKCKK